ncbi:MAG: menaquinone biosynthesis decarboxylase [Elusimicrobiota bacterium]|jgi:4-hydroxy-3-polyprenylbenzoate decarboxylase
MSFRNLSSFLTELEQQKELRRIRVEVDPELEITEIATRVVRQEGPALLFEKVKGSPFPLAINIFGSARRIELALGRPPQQIGQELLSLAQSMNPPRWLGLWKSRKALRRTFAMHTQVVLWGAPSQQIVQEPALDRLPVLKCWPQDGGRFITFGLVMTRHPQTGVRNVGVYRMQVFGPSSTGMHWQIQKGGGFHYSEAERRGQNLPLAVVIGADPCLLLAAVAPLPEGMDEVAFSGFLRGSPARLVKARSIPMRVPSEAEFILEGYVHTDERAMEGPFGDHFGHYSKAAPFPVFHVRSMTHRKRPIYLAAVVGKPPQEDRYLGNATQEILSPLIRLIHPEIQELWAYYETGFHNLLVVSVRQRYGKEAVKTGLGLLGEGQLSLTKCLVLVDTNVNVRDSHAVFRAIQQNFDPSEDVLILPGTPLDTLDFTGDAMATGGKINLDATRKPNIRPVRKSPPQQSFHFLKERDSRIIGWKLLDDALLVVQVGREGRSILESLLYDAALEGIKIVAMVSPDVDLEDRESTLWGIFTRFDCVRDVTFTEMRLDGPVARYGGRMGIDATWKKGYPDPLEMNEEIREKVNVRWDEYGI